MSLVAMGTHDRFKTLVSNVMLSESALADGRTKHHGVRSCLNQHYYDTSAWDANSLLIGSWGKDTQVSPPRDIDVLFVLPDSVYLQYQQRTGNKQSQLLQEVKQVLKARYSQTDVGADGQVVVVPFTTHTVEVAPGFTFGEQFLICDSNDGGSYKKTDPNAEARNVRWSNDATKGNTRHLVRMAKRWQWWKDVPVKSFSLELLVVDFLKTWAYAGHGYTYYDWMMRDFLSFLIGKAGGFEVVPGIYEILHVGDAWKSKAESALTIAQKACGLESEKNYVEASTEWQKLFGLAFPSA